MPKVTVLPEGKVIEVAAGDSVLNAVEAVGEALPFGCHAGTCSSCMTRVVAGMEHLESPDAQEESTLDTFDAEPDQRLMCQAVICGDITIDYSDA